MLLLVCLVSAHVPHDVITTIAPAPGLDATRPWWLIADHDDASDLYRSDDGGVSWAGVSAAPLDDKLVASVVLDAGGVVLFGDDRAWWSDDGSGAVWDAVALPFAPTAVAGSDALYLGAVDGVWTLAPDGTTTRVYAGLPVARMASGHGGVVAIGPDGTVAWGEQRTWVGPLTPPEEAYTATVVDGTVYAGARSGAVYRFRDGAWTACAASPLRDANPVHPEIVRLTSDGARLALAHADAGPAWSDDDCDSWTSDPAPIDLVWIDDLAEDDYYDYTELETAFTALGVGGGRMVVGTYDGAATSWGGAWHEPPLKGADYARGTAFSTRFAEDGRVLVAVYGCGLQQGFEGGGSWDCPGVGLDKPAAQKVLIPDDADGLVPAYALSDRRPVRSDDGGETWITLDYPGTSTHDLAVGRNGRVWGITVQTSDLEDPGSVLRSDDQGETWSGVPGLKVVGDAVITGLVDRPGMVLAYTGDRDHVNPQSVYLSADGDTFTFAVEVAEGIDDAALWPRDAPRRAVLVGDGGIDLGEGGVWWRPILPEAVGLRRVIVADDGTLIASTRTQRLWSSADGGESWVDLGVSLPSQIEALMAHPDFATSPEVVAMTPGGAFRVTLDGDLDRWIGMQQPDDMGHYAEFVRYVPDGGDVPTEGAALGSVHVLGAGSTATVWLRGRRFELTGAVVGTAVLQVYVDGVLADQQTVADLPLPSVLLTGDGFDDREHEVQLVVIDGSEVLLDYARAWSDAVALSWTAPADTGTTDSGTDTAGGPPEDTDGDRVDTATGKATAGCGCATGSAPSGAGLVALGLVWAWGQSRRPRAGTPFAMFPPR